MSFPINFNDPHIEDLATAILGKGAEEPKHREVRTTIIRLLEKVYEAARNDAVQTITDRLARLQD